MNRELQEKRTLIALAEKFGQTPSPQLIQQVAELEALEEQRLQRESEIRARVAQDLNSIFSGVKIEPGTPVPIKDIPGLGEVLEQAIESGAIQIKGDTQPATRVLQESQADQQLEIKIEHNSVDVVRDYIARNVKESTVVNPEPVLAQPQRNLEAEVRRLEQWISRIAATGAGSGEVNFRYLDDVDRSSIDKNKYLTYTPAVKKFQFVDTRASIEAFDRSTSIALLATPQLLRPNSFTNSKNILYDSSTGVFTFLTQCELTLALTVNALAGTAGLRVFQYAERNTGTGWAVIANSGKSFQLTNTQVTQIVNSQTISRQENEQIRYFIYASEANKVSLITETLPNVSGGTVYVPAIRIQYAGR